MAVGRFQPPTIGHKEMIDSVIAKAKEIGGDAFVFTTPTHGGERYPLNIDTKMGLLKKMYKDKEIKIEEAADAFKAATAVKDLGYGTIIWFAGSDRVKNYKRILKGLGVGGDVEELKRDPDSDDLKESISGTQMRKWALANNEPSFRTGLNESIRNEAPKIMKKIKNAAGGGTRHKRSSRRRSRSSHRHSRSRRSRRVKPNRGGRR